MAGYKAQTLLAQSMQKRSKAIRAAVNAYNCAILALGRTDTLDFDQAAKYGFVEEFNLLRQTRADLGEARWKEPIICEAMKHYQRVKRARKEIERVHVEMLLVFSAMANEEANFEQVLTAMKASNDSLYHVTKDQCNRQALVNSVIRARLVQITELPKYTGPPLIARKRKGLPEDTPTVSNALPAACTHLSCQVEEIDKDEVAFDEDIENAQAGGVVDFIVELGSSIKL